MTTFRDSNEAAFRRLVRTAIRKSSLTKSEQAVTIAVANLWFHHKGKGVMHPGRERIAKSARVSIKTVTRTLSKMKASGCIVAVSHESGGRAATRYRVRFVPLLMFCGAKLPEWIEGELVPLSSGGMSRFTGDKMSHGLKGRRDGAFEAGLRVIGGRDA